MVIYPLITCLNCILNEYEILLFMNTINEIQEEYEMKALATKKTSYILLSDNDSAFLLLFLFFFMLIPSHCFKRVGMRVPSFLFRVYILQNEFERFSQRSSIQYPVPITVDFVLHVCNNSEPAIRGLSRCLNIKDAFLSLQRRGHFLDSSSLLLLVGNGLNPLRSVDGQRRHLSMDASSSLTMRANSKDYSMGHLSPGFHPFNRFDQTTSFFSQTPLLRSSPFLDTLSNDDFMPEFSLSHQSSSLQPSLSSSWHNRSLFSFNSSGTADNQSIINTINSPSELWNDSTLLNPGWRTDTPSVGVRQSIDSSTSHTSLLADLQSHDCIEENQRSNSLGVPPVQELSSLSYPFLTPTLTTLPNNNELNDRYSLNESTFSRNHFNGKTSSNALNPNSAEFIPSSRQNPFFSSSHIKEDKRMNKREALVSKKHMSHI